MLRRQNIPHNVLNAKNHEREAEIVARAGQPGAVTIATNMAGRGTDIKLGEGVVYLDRDVITSRRRPGRQGRRHDAAQDADREALRPARDRHRTPRVAPHRPPAARPLRPPGRPGLVPLLHLARGRPDAPLRLRPHRPASWRRWAWRKGRCSSTRWLNRSIETAQRRVEQHNFSIRKRTLEYDDVMNKQREVIYGFRSDVADRAERPRAALRHHRGRDPRRRPRPSWRSGGEERSRRLRATG